MKSEAFEILQFPKILKSKSPVQQQIEFHDVYITKNVQKPSKRSQQFFICEPAMQPSGVFIKNL